jgi:hypothetical protein
MVNTSSNATMVIGVYIHVSTSSVSISEDWTLYDTHISSWCGKLINT